MGGSVFVAANGKLVAEAAWALQTDFGHTWLVSFNLASQKEASRTGGRLPHLGECYTNEEGIDTDRIGKTP